MHFKIPFIDKVYKVKVDYQYKKEFGFRTLQPNVRTQYRTRGYEDESWILTGDLKIAEVKWVVQYKINDAKKYFHYAGTVSRPDSARSRPPEGTDGSDALHL